MPTPPEIASTALCELEIAGFRVFAAGLDHPECCAFENEQILWAGGEEGQVYRIEADGRFEQVAHVGGFSGGLAFSRTRELYVCNPAHGVLRFDHAGHYEVFAASANGKRLICPNFAVFDREGNMFLTDSGDWGGHNGRLIRFDRAGNSVELLSSLGYANGLALSEDETALYMVESDTDRVFQIDLADAGTRASGVRIYAEHLHSVPDGLCLDTEGNLFVTCYASHRLYRIAANGKTHLFAHDSNGMLLGGPTNLCFGGAAYNEIFVANLCRKVITRASTQYTGLRPVNLRANTQQR